MKKHRILFFITLVMILTAVVAVAQSGANGIPAGGGSGAIFTTVPDGSVVNENVHYESKIEVYLDGGPPPNAPQTAAGLDDGYYVFQVTDPSGKVLLSKDPARCRVVEILDGIIVGRVAPTVLATVKPDYEANYDTWNDRARGEPCHIDDDPEHPTNPGVAGMSGQHDTNYDFDHGADGAIVVQLMPYGTTPNPGGVYKAWMTPLAAYELKGDLDDAPKPIPKGKQRPHACPDDCYNPDPGFGPPRRYVKTDNFKVKEKPPMIHVFKFEDLNGNGVWDEGEPWIGVDKCFDAGFNAVSCDVGGGWPIAIIEDLDGDGFFSDGDGDDNDVVTTCYTPCWQEVAYEIPIKVVEALPNNWYQSALFVDGGDVNNDDQPSAAYLSVPYGVMDRYVTFGNWEYSQKSGLKFHDQNANGADDGEPRLGGWTIFVDYSGDGAWQDGEPKAMTSDADVDKGEYTITSIKPGTWIIKEQAQVDWTCSYPNAGDSDKVWLDGQFVVVSNACSYSESFESGDEKFGNDFGNWTTTTKSGIKFHDRNANGVQDAGDEGLAGWMIFVDYNGDGAKSAGEPFGVSGVGGSYTIEGIVPGSFEVREVLSQHPNWECSYPNAGAGDKIMLDDTQFVVISSVCFYAEKFLSGVPEFGNDFGNWDPASKSGEKFWDKDHDGSKSDDDPRLGGWTIYVDYNDNGLLDANEPWDVTSFDDATKGQYTITGIYPGTWKVRELSGDGWYCVYPATFDAHGCYHQETFYSTDHLMGNDFGNVPAEGCTPGYWKTEQHWDSWVGHLPSDALSGVFTLPADVAATVVKLDSSGSDPTGETTIGAANLGQALRFNGSGAAGLLRAAVASLLNAAHPGVAFGYSEAEIIAAVNAALLAGEPFVGNLATELDDANNATNPVTGEHSCPLN